MLNVSVVSPIKWKSKKESKHKHCQSGVVNATDDAAAAVDGVSVAVSLHFD